MSLLDSTMDQTWMLRLKLILKNLFVISASIIHLQGNPAAGDYDLHCVTDYLFTINCTISITSSPGSSIYWLTFTETYEKTMFVCTLQNNNGYHFCSVDTSGPMPNNDDYNDDSEIFSDMDTFEISLCHNQNDGSEICTVLDGNYTPFTNIKPNAPCCLTVTHNSSQHHFAWKSTYEEYEHYTSLVDSFKYHLHFFKRGDRHNGKNSGISWDINTERTNYSVDDQIFEPATEYTARLRSSPNLVFYKGQWSDWSSEVHWRTGSEVNNVPGLSKKLFIPICLVVPMVLLLCCAHFKKWRQTPFIPTPAPYFHTLYSDCQGDFKSWVTTQENTADMLKEEASIQIDTIAKCTEIVEEENDHSQFHHQLMKGAYRNITEPVYDASLPGVPYAVSTMDSLSAAGSLLTSPAHGSEHGCCTEGDSGCWLCSDASLESGSPWYCNDYCKLSAFKQTQLSTAEHKALSSITGQ